MSQAIGIKISMAMRSEHGNGSLMIALMRADLLELVAKKLDENPPFDFTNWIGPTWEGKDDLSCGTTACALGWAATIPELQEAGLYISGSSSYKSVGGRMVPANACVRFNGDTRGRATAWTPSIAAAEIVFEITQEEANYLFMPGSLSALATARQVAAHIREFIQRGGMPYDRAAARFL